MINAEIQPLHGLHSLSAELRGQHNCRVLILCGTVRWISHLLGWAI